MYWSHESSPWGVSMKELSMRVGVRSLATVVLTLGLVTGAEAQMMATAESISPRSAEVVSTRSLLTRRAQLTISGVELSAALDRKSTRLNSSHVAISYAVFC